MIPDECIEIDCGHLFCKKCIYILNTNLSFTVICPLCNITSNTFKYIKKNNIFAYKILCGINIYCPNKGCDKELPVGNLKDHLKKCDFELVDCSYCEEKNIYRKDLKNHLTNNIEDHLITLMDEVRKLKQEIKKRN